MLVLSSSTSVMPILLNACGGQRQEPRWERKEKKLGMRLSLTTSIFSYQCCVFTSFWKSGNLKNVSTVINSNSCCDGLSQRLVHRSWSWDKSKRVWLMLSTSNLIQNTNKTTRCSVWMTRTPSGPPASCTTLAEKWSQSTERTTQTMARSS